MANNNGSVKLNINGNIFELSGNRYALRFVAMLIGNEYANEKDKERADLLQWLGTKIVNAVPDEEDDEEEE